MKDFLRLCACVALGVSGSMMLNQAIDEMSRILTTRHIERQSDRLWQQTIREASKADGPGTGG